MKNRTVLILLATLTATILLFTGCGKKADTEPVVSESAETEDVEEVESIEETEPVEEAEQTESVEEEPVAEDVPLTQEELDTLKSQATTDAQKEALDAYENITKEGTWTDAYGVTYTEVVGKPDGSFRKMSEAEIEETLATANPKSDDYMIAQAEKEGSFVYYDTVTGKVYYDPYKLSEDSKPIIQENIERSQGEGDLSAEEVKELLGEERYRELFGDYTD